MVLLFLPHNHIQSQKENIYLPGARQILSFHYVTSSDMRHIRVIIKACQKQNGTKMKIFCHCHNTILLKTKKYYYHFTDIKNIKVCNVIQLQKVFVAFQCSCSNVLIRKRCKYWKHKTTMNDGSSQHFPCNIHQI